MTSLGEIVVRRENAWWQDRLRRYRVIVDEKEVARVGNGAEARISIPPGEHVVQMQIDWCYSNALSVVVQAGQAQPLVCGPNGAPLLALLYITFWRRKYLWLRLNTVG